jgi:hypothetical protein
MEMWKMRFAHFRERRSLLSFWFTNPHPQAIIFDEGFFASAHNRLIFFASFKQHNFCFFFYAFYDVKMRFFAYFF